MNKCEFESHEVIGCGKPLIDEKSVSTFFFIQKKSRIMNPACIRMHTVNADLKIDGEIKVDRELIENMKGL